MGDTSTKSTMNNIIGVCTKKGSHFILVEKVSKKKSTLNMLILGYTAYGNKCQLCLGKTDSGKCRYSGKLYCVSKKGSYESRTANESRCPLDLVMYAGVRTSYLGPVVVRVKSGIKLSLFMSCFLK